jgi:hypothetical protein
MPRITGAESLVRNVSCLMRKSISILIGALLALAVVYEVAFRFITADCGLVDATTNPPRVNYSRDALSFPWRNLIFRVRTRLPFGKVRLAPEHLYVDGGRVYCRAPDGAWLDMGGPAPEGTQR